MVIGRIKQGDRTGGLHFVSAAESRQREKQRSGDGGDSGGKGSEAGPKKMAKKGDGSSRST